MTNFGRALRLAMQHRLVFATSVVCAILVAVLWGGNIGAVYPFVEVVFRGQSLQQWVAGEIQKAEQKADGLRTSAAELEQQLAQTNPPDAALKRQLADAETRLKHEEQALAGYRWLQPHIERYLPDDPFKTLVIIVAALMFGTVLKSIFLVAHTILVGKLASLATFDLRKQFYRRTLRMDLATFGADGSGELMSRFTYDMENVSAGLNSLFGKAVREPLKMIVCLAGAAFICWRLLVLSLVIVPIAGFLVVRLGKLLKRANRKGMEEMSQIYAILEETFHGIKAVKAFTMERTERLRFHKNSKEYYEKSMRIARYDSLTHPVTEMMGIATISLAILAGAYLVLNQQTHLFGTILISHRPLTLGSLFLFFGLLSGVSDPARKLSEVFSRIQRAAAASDRIYSLLDREPSIRDPKQPTPLPRHRKELHFSGVSYSYVPSQPVLEEIDLKIPFGETIAIVGPNGCGKSTLVNLLPRFFDAEAGSVKLDGVDLRQVRLRDLRSQIGLVTQETLLFDDTVFNNIRYGSPWATRDQVLEAAKQAHAHRFIEQKLEKGYDTIVGPQGSFLSGGQRQRIALARAILRDPPILILDEATSQVDLESEQLIHKVLEQFVRHRTTLIVTHRMSTLALAHRIVVMSAGRIADVGRHEELLRRCDLYRRLHEIQFKEIA